jgi:pectate lyase
VSHVVADGAGVANDAIEITGGAKNILIDHCDLYSDMTHGKDYYDGLLDIKNGSSFVTVSWCAIHDHYKASLISSGDEQVGDAVIRATYHHNYFHNCGSRLPSIRFGKAHIFNNYYLNNPDGSGVNSRMGAVVRVDGNYFQNTENPICFLDSATTGYWDVANNIFTSCTGSQPTTSTGQLTPPYPYTLDTVADLPTTVPAGAGVGKL